MRIINTTEEKQNVIFLVLITLLIGSIFWINSNINALNETIQEAELEKIKSLQLVDELRQSSDDLTNMARLYVTTGKATHKEYFNQIIQIREGNKLRPLDYHDVYWDFVLSTGKHPRPGTKKQSLLSLIDSISSSNEAKTYFIQAKNSSDDLILIEEEAFNAMQGEFKDSTGNFTISSVPNQELAIQLLHSHEYFEAKAKIMKSIQDFSHFIQTYTDAKLQSYQAQRESLDFLQIALLTLMIITLLLVIINSLIKLIRANKQIEQKSQFGIKKVLIEVRNSWVIQLTSLIFCVLIVMYLGFTNKSIKEDSEKAIQSTLATVLASTEQSIDSWLSQHAHRLENYVENNQGAFKKLSIDGPSGLNESLRQHFLSEAFYGFMLVENSGQISVSSHSGWMGEQLKSISNDEISKNVLDGNAQSVFIFPDNKGADREFNHLIKISKRIDEGSSLILFFDPQKEFSAILQLGRVGNSGESYAINKDGVMISESRFTEDLKAQSLLKKNERSVLNIHLIDPSSEEYTKMAGDILAGYSGSDIKGYNDYRGIKVIGSWKWLGKYGIGITTEIDHDEGYASYIKVERLNWYTGAVFVLLMFVLTVVFVFDKVKVSLLKDRVLQSEKKFRSITETASDAIISADKHGIIGSWNKAAQEIFGYTEQEAIGQPLDIIIPKEYKDKHREGMHRVSHGGEKRAIGQTVELNGQRKDGTTLPIELSVSNWDGADGMEFSGIIRDISERIQFEEALKKANKRMSGELNVAKDIQMSMLPLIFPAFPKRKDIDIFAELIPAREVGGDFYDFFFLDEDHLCFVVGDVSGKGVPAALMMAVCKTLIKSKASTDKSTASIMTQVNSEMAHENTNYMFVTVFIGILNTQTGELTYTNAGHNPTYIKKRNGSLEKLTTLHGPVIAAMEGLSYKESIVNVNSGDSIFAYTDGIPEAHNVQNELYGNETLDTFILNNPFISPQKMIENVIEDVHTFEGEAEKFDDLTALCIQYHGTENGAVQRDIVTINNKIAEVQIVIEKFEAFSSALNLPVEIAMKMSIVFDELLANVIKYAYTDDKEHLIYVEFKLAENKLILIIEDKGIPFNPFQKEPPDTMLSVQERAVGGLGIHIVKNLMDEYHYTRTTNKNILTLIKYNVLN